MLTIILSVILFGFGGWLLQYNCFAHFGYDFGYVPNNSDYVVTIFLGCLFGFIIGFILSVCLSKFVARKYPINKKFPLSHFSDGKTYLVNNDGDINYCRAEGDVRTANRHDIAYIKVNDKEDFPYVAYCQPERASFWGLFATFICLSDNIFVLPKETMIKKGRVDIITTTTHKLVLEP